MGVTLPKKICNISFESVENTGATGGTFPDCAVVHADSHIGNMFD